MDKQVQYNTMVIYSRLYRYALIDDVVSKKSITLAYIQKIVLVTFYALEAVHTIAGSSNALQVSRSSLTESIHMLRTHIHL